jgi:hypothetical protein
MLMRSKGASKINSDTGAALSHISLRGSKAPSRPASCARFRQSRAVLANDFYQGLCCLATPLALATQSLVAV